MAGKLGQVLIQTLHDGADGAGREGVPAKLLGDLFDNKIPAAVRAIQKEAMTEAA